MFLSLLLLRTSLERKAMMSRVPKLFLSLLLSRTSFERKAMMSRVPNVVSFTFTIENFLWEEGNAEYVEYQRGFFHFYYWEFPLWGRWVEYQILFLSPFTIDNFFWEEGNDEYQICFSHGTFPLISPSDKLFRARMLYTYSLT